MTNPALLIIAHGSRLDTSNQEILYLTERIQRINQQSGKFSLISHSFLELCQPSIPEGIDELINQGAKKIIVFPYFLAAGRHVREDIPEIISQKKREQPNVEIILNQYFGLLPNMEQIIFNFIGSQ